MGADLQGVLPRPELSVLLTCTSNPARGCLTPLQWTEQRSAPHPPTSGTATLHLVAQTGGTPPPGCRMPLILATPLSPPIHALPAGETIAVITTVTAAAIATGARVSVATGTSQTAGGTWTGSVTTIAGGATTGARAMSSGTGSTTAMSGATTGTTAATTVTHDGAAAAAAAAGACWEGPASGLPAGWACLQGVSIAGWVCSSKCPCCALPSGTATAAAAAMLGMCSETGLRPPTRILTTSDHVMADSVLVNKRRHSAVATNAWS